MGSPETLIVDRRAGRKVCRIESAEIWSRPRTGDKGETQDEVVLNIEASRPVEGAEGFESKVDITVSWREKPFSFQSLVDRTIEVPKAYDAEIGDHVATFYYYEHLDMNESSLRFTELIRDRIRLQLSGVVEDPSADEPGEIMRVFVDATVSLTQREFSNV